MSLCFSNTLVLSCSRLSLISSLPCCLDVSTIVYTCGSFCINAFSFSACTHRKIASRWILLTAHQKIPPRVVYRGFMVRIGGSSSRYVEVRTLTRLSEPVSLLTYTLKKVDFRLYLNRFGAFSRSRRETAVALLWRRRRREAS